MKGQMPWPGREIMGEAKSRMITCLLVIGIVILIIGLVILLAFDFDTGLNVLLLGAAIFWITFFYYRMKAHRRYVKKLEEKYPNKTKK